MPDKYDVSKCVFAGWLKVLWELGEGSHGEVLLVEDCNSKTFAVKTASAGSFTVKLLEHEYKVYQHLQCHKKKVVGIPQVFKYGFDHLHNKYVLVMSRLGASMRDVMELNKAPIPEYAALRIGCQLIRRLQYVHSLGLVHGDIKPRNILCGYKSFEKIYLVDFGLATFYKNMKSGKHYCMMTGQRFKGTEAFASRNAHKGFSLSCRDDLESLGYSLIYMIRGSLPWSRSAVNDCRSWNGLDETAAKDASSKSKEMRDIKAMKETTTIEMLCDSLAECMSVFMRHVYGLAFDEAPDYSFLIKTMEGRMDQLKRIGDEDNGCELIIWTVPYERSRFMRVRRDKEIWADCALERDIEDEHDDVEHRQVEDTNVESILNATTEPIAGAKKKLSCNLFRCFWASTKRSFTPDEVEIEDSDVSLVQPDPAIYQRSQRWWSSLLVFLRIQKPTPEPVVLHYSLEGFDSEIEQRDW